MSSLNAIPMYFARLLLLFFSTLDYDSDYNYKTKNRTRCLNIDCIPIFLNIKT